MYYWSMKKQTYRYDSRREAQKAWPEGNGAWFAGHGPENLWIVVGTLVGEDASNSVWIAEVTFRPATHSEYRDMKLQWLKKQRRSETDMLSAGDFDPEPDTPAAQVRQDAREAIKLIDAEIAELEVL